MSLSNISEVILSINDRNDDRELECNFNFIYNNYSEDETTINDDIISNESRNISSKKNRFIRIVLEEPKSTTGIPERIQFNEIYNSFLEEISNKNLYEEDRNFFNKLDILTPTKKSIVLDQKREDLEKYYKLYSYEKTDFDESEFLGLDKSRKISFESNSFDDNDFLQKEFVENYNAENIKDYDQLVSNEEVKSARRSKNNSVEKFKSGVLLPGLKTISRSINFGAIDEYAYRNGVFAGLYVEKFCKEEDEFDFKCAKFFPRDHNIRSQATGFSINIEDESVRYGRTYRYVCHYVYHFMCLNEDNRFLLDHFLLCGHPYISKNIVCKEYNRPPVATGLTPAYDKLVKKMILNWRHPSNYENDVKGYQILKRFSLEEPFVLIRQLEGHLETDAYELTELVSVDSILKTPGYIPDFYEDETYDKNKMCIYTIRSIDAHGMISNYGEQIAVYYDFLRDSLIVDSIASPGASVMYPNETIRNKSMFFENKVDIVDNLPTVKSPKKIKVYVTPDYGNVTSNNRVEKVFLSPGDGVEYQFTFTELNSLLHRSDKFTISNFG